MVSALIWIFATSVFVSAQKEAMSSILPKRLLVLGFDAMDLELAKSWASVGYLPNLCRLFDCSAWTDYVSPPEYSSGTMWPSINTGVGPLQHDFYSFGRFCEGSYQLRMARSSDVASEPFWKWFAECGRRIVLADIPFSIPKTEYGGRQFWGWSVHDNWAWDKSSVPAELLSELTQGFGPHPVSSCYEYTTRTDSLRKLKAGLIQGIERRTAILKAMIMQGGWDLLYGAYSETHCAGHRMWHLEDEAHPQYNREEVAMLGHGLRDVYRAIDKSLGELIACAGHNTICVVFFSHGMGPNYHAAHLFPEFVNRFNDSWIRRSSGGENNAATQRPWLDTLWLGSVQKIPVSWRGRAKRRLPISMRGRIALQRLQTPKRWSSAPAFSVPKDGFSALRVNLIGRETQGRIQPGQEYRRYLDAFVEALGQLASTDTGERVVARIFRVDEQTDPLRIGAGTDLVVWWSKSRPVVEVRSPVLGDISGVSSEEDTTGEHVMRGMIMVSHEQAKRGHQIIEGVKPMDIPATLCELARIKPGRILDGQSLCSNLLTVATE